MINGFKPFQPFDLGALAFGKSEIQKAVDVLRKFGSDAHAYIPGIGMLNGLQAANYIDSAGTQVGVVDSIVGRVNDAMGVLGEDLLSGAGSFDSATGWTLGAGWAVSGGALNAAAATGDARFLLGTSTVNKSFRVTGEISSLSGGSLNMYVGGFQNVVVNTTGPFSVIVAVTNAASNQYFEIVHNSTPTAVVDNISVREIYGIHASQTTTGSKPILRKDANGKYYWQFDGSNDSLQLGGPLFQMSDDHCVIAGVRVDSLATARIIFSQRSTSSTFPIVGQLQVATDGSVNAYYRNLENTQSNLLASTGGFISVGNTAVITETKVGSTSVIEVNNTTVATAGTLPGSGTFPITSASLGASAENGSNPLSGWMHCLIAVKGAVSESDKTLLKKLVANMSGVTLP